MISQLINLVSQGFAKCAIERRGRQSTLYGTFLTTYNGKPTSPTFASSGIPRLVQVACELGSVYDLSTLASKLHSLLKQDIWDNP